MALLVYSDKCKHSQEVIAFIKTQPSLVEIVRFHNVTTAGVPSKKITRVPTLVTNEGKMCVGAEVKDWLVSMIPTEFESWDCSAGLCQNLDGTEGPGLFEFERYGETLQPVLTPELEARISMSVNDAYQAKRSG
jgi:hypothetical protein